MVTDMDCGVYKQIDKLFVMNNNHAACVIFMRMCGRDTYYQVHVNAVLR